MSKYKYIDNFMANLGIFSPEEFKDAAGEIRVANYYDLCIHRYRRQNDVDYHDKYVPILTPEGKQTASRMYHMMTTTVWSSDMVVLAGEENLPQRWYSGPPLVYWLAKDDPRPSQWTLVNGRLCSVVWCSVDGPDNWDPFLSKWDFYLASLEACSETD